MRLAKLMAAAIVLSACGADQQALTTAPEQGVSGQLSPRTMQLWADNCALCHVDGTAMAPRVGDAQAWLPRLAQGKDALLKHTLEGLNDMPPLGYCMACERTDFMAMIDFMSSGITDE